MSRPDFSIKTGFARLLAAMLLLCILHGAAYAQDAGEGKRLEALFSGMIAQYKDAAAANGGELVADGAVLVEHSGKYYAVTLPALSVRGANGARTDIGMIAVNAVPAKEPGVWNMTVALPSPVTAYDPAGKAVITVSMAGQNFFGVFHEKYRNFTRINAQYRDVTVYNEPDRVTLKIPDLKVVYDLADDGKGLWSGPAKFALSGLSLDFENGAAARIGKIAVGSQVVDYDLNAAIQYQEKIDALAENYKSGDKKTISAAHMMGLYNLVFNFLGTAWNGFSFDVALEDFTIDRPAIPGSPAGKFRLERFASGIAMNGFRTNDVTLGLKAGYSGFAFEPVEESDRALMPTHGTLDVSINKLPYKSMVEAGAGSLQTALDAPAMAQLAGLQALALLPRLMTEAGTNVTVRATGLGNANYNARMDGTMTADMAAVKSYAGNIRASISGLDYLLAQANAQLKNPELDAPKRQKLTEMVTTLTVLQMAGQQGKDEAGNEVRTYDFQIDKDGRTLLNGVDMSVLFPAKTPDAAPRAP